MKYNFDGILNSISQIELFLNSDDWSADDNISNDLRLLLELSKKRIKSLYSNFLTQPDFNNLQSYFTNIINYCNQKSYPAIQNQIIVIKDTINKIPFAGKGETTETLNKIVDDFIEKNKNVISDLKNKKEDIEERYNNLIEELNELSGKISNNETQVNNIITQFQKQFSDAQEERVKYFSLSQQQNNEAFNAKESERNSMFSGEIEKYMNWACSNLKDIEDIKSKVESIYGIVGKSTIIGTQQKYADKEQKNSFVIFVIASVLMTCCAIFQICILCNGINNNIDILTLLYRSLIGAVLLIPAFYLANVSKKHREKENKYRELEIKMATITPYFLEISDKNEELPEKDKVKLELAEKLLSPNQEIPDNNVVLPPEIIELAKVISNSIKETKK